MSMLGSQPVLLISVYKKIKINECKIYPGSTKLLWESSCNDTPDLRGLRRDTT